MRGTDTSSKRAFGAGVRAIGVAAVGLAVTLLASCGAERPPPAGDSVSPPPRATSATGFSDDGGASKPPGCGELADGGTCDCTDVSVFGDAPNLYFVLDRSGSMYEDDKWDQVRVTVGHLLRGLGPRANFGATVFPAPNATCGPGVEVMSLRPGDAPSGTGEDGPTTRLLLSTTNMAPGGGTPTAETLRGVLSALQRAQGKTFVILATDGAPNCNAEVSCSSDQCQPNIDSINGCTPNGPNCCEPPQGNHESCVDGTATVAAVSSLRNAGFPTYVIGIPGSSAYASLLDQLAVAGGTAQATSPKYFRIDSAGSDDLLRALKKIAAQIVATCAFKLKTVGDPNAINVYLDETVLPKDPSDGWKLDGDTLTLLGSSCSRVLSGDILDVRIISGCPTIGVR